MVKVNEAATAGTPLNAALVEGVDTLALNQDIVFTKYIKAILPADGFVFWVRADLLSPGALYNAAQFNGPIYDDQPTLITAAPTVTVRGSFHFATNQDQNEDETIGINRVIFTAEKEIQAFNDIGPMVMYIGAFPNASGGTIRFAFNQRAPFYEQAGISHYLGNAIYPPMESQIIDGTGVDLTHAVVSNSLPIWLSIPRFSAVWWTPQWDFPLFPSYLVPPNIRPPYATVHVVPEQTQAIQAVPFLGPDSSDYQLLRDLVRITIYGIRNDDARSFLVSVLEYIRNVEAIGLMNMPAIRDEKRTQSELGIIAMKKTIEFEVSYTGGAARTLARQLILDAIPTVIIAPFSPR